MIGKRFVKQVFVTLGLTNLLDKLLFGYNWLAGYSKNFSYQRRNPDFAFPPSYYLYETYRLDYQMYREDGFQSAHEIIDWASPYLTNIDRMLEWGCGVARMTRHFTSSSRMPKKVVGVDINAGMIQWNKSNIPEVDFFQCSYLPPLQLESSEFDLVVGLSVFTHIECAHHDDWIQEIHRVLRTGGVFIVTTHGSFFHEKLNQRELTLLNESGCYTHLYSQKGHRMMSSYSIAASFRKKLEIHFEVLEFYDGGVNPAKVGGQDLWILRAR